MLLLQLRVWSECRRAGKEPTVREMGVAGPDRIVNVVTSHSSHFLEIAQHVQILMAAMCYHRFYIGNTAKYQFILYQILIEARLE